MTDGSREYRTISTTAIRAFSGVHTLLAVTAQDFFRLCRSVRLCVLRLRRDRAWNADFIHRRRNLFGELFVDCSLI